MVNKKIQKKIIVIGSNSFSAGSLISFLLTKNAKVFGISRSNINKKNFLRFNSKSKNFKFFKYDLNKNINEILYLIKRIKPEIIINYASQSMVGQSWKNSSDWFYTNSYNTVKFYEALTTIDLKFKLIHVSTPEIYGNLEKNISETKIYNPTTPYAVSRVTADQYLDILNRRKKIFYCSIRASNVYGEYQRLYRIIPKTIFSILKNQKLSLDGGGFSKRNFIHIDDVTAATYKIMNKGKSGEIYHISGSDIISIRDLVKQICKIMNYKFSKLVKIGPERPGKDKFYNISSKKLNDQMNWRPKISLDKGINRCIDWIKRDLKFFSEKDINYIHKK